MSETTRVGRFVVTEKSPAALGRILSVHRTHVAAHNAAVRCGGVVEYAEVVAAVQAGATYTAAVQAACGSEVRPARVTVQP
jgi:hypothetical protein